MKKLLLLAALTAIHTGLTAQSIDVDALEIPHERYVLINGLTLLVHEDHKAPIVAVSVWYNVGSKDEKEGKTGFAHLFEHLMFNGSENYDGEYFKPFEQVGATDMNGTTWFDRTNYFQNVPSTAVDLALWMESDRMGHLLGAITQEKLDNQRGVVQNEKRMGDNRPYGKVEYSMLEGLFPQGHPYRWSTIGSMQDLNSASLDDVKAWFEQYYGAANTVVVLAGDITPAVAKQKVEHYFGDIPPGPPLKQLKQFVPVKDTSTLGTLYDKVSARKIFRSVPVAGRISADKEALNILAKVLGEGKTSRLYQRLVEEEELATDVSANLEEHSLASIFSVDVTLSDEASEEKVSAIISEEIAALANNEISDNELEGARMRILASTIRGMEKIGGFNGKANVLAEGELYAGDAGYFRQSLQRYLDATPESVLAVASQWLSNPYHQMTVYPFPNFAASDEGADRTSMPQVNEMPTLSFPSAEKFTLDNGMPVYFVKRDAVPDVSLRVTFNSGFAADAFGFPLGTSIVTMNLFEEGTGNVDAEAYKTKMDMLGAESKFLSNLDRSFASLQSLTASFEPALSLFSRVIMNPAHREADLDRVKTIRYAKIADEKANPGRIPLRELPPILFGEDHPYSMPITGTGTEDSIAKITPDIVNTFYKTWIRPDNAEIIVVGAIAKDDLLNMLNETFGQWQVNGKKGEKTIPDVPLIKGKTFYLADRPDSPQSVILAGKLIPGVKDDNALATDIANTILGGKFTARINMNLREDKGWSYGTQTLSIDTEGMRPWLIYAPVQSDKTVASVQEIDKEVSAFFTAAPATEDELTETVTENVRQLPGLYETNSDLIRAIQSSLTYDRPLNYPMLLQQKYDALSLEDVRGQAAQFSTDDIVYLIVGEASLYKEALEKMGKVVMLDIE